MTPFAGPETPTYKAKTMNNLHCFQLETSLPGALYRAYREFMWILMTLLRKISRNPSYFGCFGLFCANHDGFLLACPRKVIRTRVIPRNSLYNAPGEQVSDPPLSAPKSRDSLRLRRRCLPLPKHSRDFLRPQDARFPSRRKSLANRDFFCELNG